MTCLQRILRGFFDRKQVQKLRKLQVLFVWMRQKSATILIQRYALIWRGFRVEKRNKAVNVVQKMFRGKQGRQMVHKKRLLVAERKKEEEDKRRALETSAASLIQKIAWQRALRKEAQTEVTLRRMQKKIQQQEEEDKEKEAQSKALTKAKGEAATLLQSTFRQK